MGRSVWTVDVSSAGIRLDKFLAADGRLGSRARAATALERGKIFLNEQEASIRDAARPLTPGDTVRLWEDRPGSSRPVESSRQRGPLNIVHEDSALLVLNKPPGVLSVPLERKSGAASVYDQLEDYFRSHGRRKPFVVHRIDRDTSGLVVFAKDARSQQALKDQFRRREPERVYLAAVYGHPEPVEGRWVDYLVWDTKALIQKATSPRDPRAAEAISDYRVIETFRGAGASLVEVRLHSGKRNQIRIQARLRGHTLIGERRYIFGPETLRPVQFERQALHAFRLAFRHPVDGRPMRFEAPLPADFEALIRSLRAQP